MSRRPGQRPRPFYPDEGCWVAPACLRCPRAMCVLDEEVVLTPEELQERSAAREVNREGERAGRAVRAREIHRLRTQGRTSREIAEAIGVTPRTVQRRIRSGGAAVL